MDKREVRALVLDIGHLSYVHGTDISKIMDELNTLESYKPFQAVLKEHKEFKKQLEAPNKYETYFGIIRDLMGYDKDMDNTTLGHLFQDIALLKQKKYVTGKDLTDEARKRNKLKPNWPDGL